MGKFFIQPETSSTAQRRLLRADALTQSAPGSFSLDKPWNRSVIALMAALSITIHLALRFGAGMDGLKVQIPLLIALVGGGFPLLCELILNVLRRQFGSDLLAGISIVTSLILGEYLAGTLVVLMLSGGQALEVYAKRSASSVLRAMASRMPSIAHRERRGVIRDVPLNEVTEGDDLDVYPHEICPVDGMVIQGHGVMDESYLTGEPFQITKTVGSCVISGAINGESVLVIRATKRATDSRYAKIMEVMRESESKRPRLRRLGDRLGAIYTPIAIGVAVVAWVLSGQAIRFLAVLVIATPCPLLIAIPTAIVGTISLCARRAIIVRNPVVLEQITQCRTAIFDKTGTLTYGEPKLIEQVVASGFQQKEVLALVASLERYSKHPMAHAILAAAIGELVAFLEATEVREPPGCGLRGTVGGHGVLITSRSKALVENVIDADQIPPTAAGLECVIAIDNRYAATFRFHDAPRAEGRSFIQHLGPSHQIENVMIVSGDREPEVRYLANEVGVRQIHAGKTPEEKLQIVRAETAAAKTLYVGDGINDAPAMMAATVGLAIGQNSDVTAEAAGVVVMDNSLRKVDEFMHISRRMRIIALQSAVGGMALSVIGMVFAATGHINPVSGAILQEIIDVVAVLNALRGAFPPRVIHDL